MNRKENIPFIPSSKSCIVILLLTVNLFSQGNTIAQVLGQQVDLSQDFQKFEQVYFIGDQVTNFDHSKGEGFLKWSRYLRQAGYSFNKVDISFVPAKATEFPATEYDENPQLPFLINFITPRTIRLRFSTRQFPIKEVPSIMFAGELAKDNSWKPDETDSTIIYKSVYGEVRIIKNPFHLEFYDTDGKLLTRTQNIGDPKTFSNPVPFSFVRRAKDFGRSFAASFQLRYDEKIFGCGESFTRLNKRGQKIILCLGDGMGVQSQRMYKSVPFFLSSNGYGMFVHTSSPVTFDFGNSFDQSNVIYTSDEVLDLFVFLGDPKEILSEYTNITGRSPVPPLWSFGLWMSRITYKSEDEVREVAAKLRDHKIPSDVLHLDTGWFETDWQCNYKFSTTRFKDPAKMISDLRNEGFRISLWQLPYFTSKNELYKKIVDSGFNVRNENGNLPYEDAILDFSNPECIKWYQGLLAGLLKMGVGAIKVDFGEDAPLYGLYASGRTGFYEHNLFPLRYNKAAADITKEITGESIIWARSAWAGSQRYPLHWGGDAENTNSAMAATLRGGLSFGLSGFTYWSHDVGGFVDRPSEDLYRRWLAFGVLTSHTRCHGATPREPWTFGDAFENDFRKIVELKYKLMPYIYAQAKFSSENGYPMLRTLFFEFPDDATSWLIEDEYMLGSDFLVAPLFEKSRTRNIYLPKGSWIDYQTHKIYDGAQWYKIEAGEIPIIMLVKDNSVIPHIKLAQSTSEMNWNEIELQVFSSNHSSVTGMFSLPDAELKFLKMDFRDGAYVLYEDPVKGKINWQITVVE